ncbi:MAG: ammonia-forming cytochrome c nitrite reductase subunit c552 [Gemmataceae bacterium]
MTEERTPSSPAPTPNKSGWGARIVYLLVILVTGVAGAGITALLLNIQERKWEGQQRFVKVVDLSEETIDPTVWGQNFPRQYDSYKLTVDSERTAHGGSDAMPPDKLKKFPYLKKLFAGYAFSIDFRELRGHAYMLKDQEKTKRVTERKQPGACLHCHASVLPAYREAGNGDIMKGFEKVCAMTWTDARKLVKHPVSCIDCHDPKTVQLRVTRPAFLNGIDSLAKSDYELPHFPSIERWRKRKQSDNYDPNELASRQEMRSFVCAQGHVEYYFAKDTKAVTYPWANGLEIEQIEKYYDDISFHDWKHKITGTSMLKAQHPEFEMWNQGIHARKGVSCADCHMPYKREGAIKVSDHRVRSPMLNVARACQVCHREEEKQLVATVDRIQGKTKKLIDRTGYIVEGLIGDIESAQDRSVAEELINKARQFHRKAQWRLDYVLSENSVGFHASQEYARILAESIDFARQGQLVLRPNTKK